jgi:hypothetical protein
MSFKDFIMAKDIGKMKGGPAHPKSEGGDAPRFPNPGDKSLTSAHGKESGVIRSGVAPTPKTLSGRDA